MKFIIGLLLYTSQAFAGTETIVKANIIEGQATVKNFVANSHFEKNTVGYSTYKDAAGTRPVDGTGGSPTQLTISRTTSSPLAGEGSLLLTKAAANAQGEGVSVPFTIDSAQKASLLSIKLNYEVASGTFASGSDSTDGDLIVYLYDVTNSQLIEPVNFKFLASSGEYVGSFQSSATSTSYRLIFHVASTSTSAWTLKLDNISVGTMQATANSSQIVAKAFVNATQTITNADAVNIVRFDAVSYDSTGSINTGAGWKYTAKESGKYKVDVSFMFTAATWELNSRFYCYLVKNGSTNEESIDLRASLNASASVEFFSSGSGEVSLNAGDYIQVVIIQNSGSSKTISTGVPGTISISKIADTSQSYAGVVVAAKAVTNTTQSIPSGGSGSQILFQTKEYDSTNSFNTSTGTYIVPVSGKYSVSGFIQLIGSSGNANVAISVLKNGSFLQNAGGPYVKTGEQHRMPFNNVIDCVVGDTISINMFHDTGVSQTINGSSIQSFVSIQKINTDSTVPALQNPMTTGGDIIYGDTNGVPKRLANGTAGQVLMSKGGTTAPIWKDQDSSCGLAVSSSGTINVETNDCVSTCSNSSGSATCNFNANYFSSTPICQVTINGDVTATNLGAVSVSAISTSSVTIKQSTSGVGNISRDLLITCSGPRTQ